jgi:phage host-nuclease inhibitor protein Gam
LPSNSSLYNGVLPANKIPAQERKTRNCQVTGDTVTHNGKRKTADIIHSKINGQVTLNLSLKIYEVALIDSGNLHLFKEIENTIYDININNPIPTITVLVISMSITLYK